MKRSIKLAVAAAVALTSTAAFATNGDHLIGLGAKARSMGGIGIGMSHGAESGLANPALITSVKSTEISFGGTVFMPDVKYTTTTLGGSYGVGTVAASGTSKADMSVIPEVSLASKVNDNFWWGVGMWGTAGMGVDYRDLGGMEMVTNLQLMQFGVPLAYKTNGIAFGITPILQYGALDINYAYDTDSNASNGTDATNGAGVAQDLSFGYTVGLSYETDGLTIGAVYKSPIEMTYRTMLTGATDPFVNFGIFTDGQISDKLEQPAEIGVGTSYVFGEHTVAFDYKRIQWSDAKGYREFKWDDQNVYAVGYQYKTNEYAVRLGYNYGKSPIKDAGAINANSSMTPTDYAGNAINTFNLLGFPATVESHYTVGGSYNLSKATSLDLAYVYAPKTTTTLQTMAYDTDGDPTNGTDGGTQTSVEHSQQSVSIQLNYNF